MFDVVHDVNEYMDLALRWLVKVYDQEKCGWGWIQHIPANEQNTSEVVVALLNHGRNKYEFLELVRECAREQLLVAKAQVTQDWVWVTKALLELRRFGVFESDSEEKKLLDLAIGQGLAKIQELWDSRNGGWPDSAGAPSQITWTGVVLYFLHEYLPVRQVNAAKKFLARAQNADGGWGLWKMSVEEVEEMFADHPRLISRAAAQINSNAGCTALAVLALERVEHAPGQVRKGVKWLLENTMENGGWPVFHQVGVRGSAVYTWRHFSTAWAIRALLAVDSRLIFDPEVVSSVMYLIRLRDFATNGWRTSEDADPFTWATCNALDALADALACLNKKPAELFQVIAEWHHERHLVNIVTLKLLGSNMIFNKSASLAFAFITSILLMVNSILFFGRSEVVLLSGLGTLLMVSGVPWTLYVRAHYKERWIDAYGIVYGILGVIIGLVLSIIVYVKF